MPFLLQNILSQVTLNFHPYERFVNISFVYISGSFIQFLAKNYFYKLTPSTPTHKRSKELAQMTFWADLDMLFNS